MTASRIFRAIGCPGAGLKRKTTWLSVQSQTAAAKHGGSAVQIVSLTKTAASEIGSRETAIPPENCSTLHAACYRALDAPALAETRASLREFAAEHPEYASQGDAHDSPDDDAIGDAGDDLHAACQNRRARMTPVEQWTPDEQAYGQAWAAFCEQTGRMDFTGLLERCLADGILPVTHPRVLLADEAQDMSTLEFAVIKMWSAQTDTTVVVGDESQALYSWRGSDAGGMGSLDVTGERVLDQSYRCSHAVRDLAVRWMRDGGVPVVDWKPTDQRGSVHAAPMALCDTRDMLDQIEALRAPGKTTMVLASCGYMLGPLIGALRDEGIAFSNPHRRGEARWNPLHGKAARALTAYHREPMAAGVWTWGELHTWVSVLVSKDNLARGAKAAIEEHCRPDQFGTTYAGQTVPLDTLRELLGGGLEHPALWSDPDWFLAALKAEHRKAGEYAVRVLRRDPAALTTEPALVLGSVHSVKGASADHVVIAPDLSRTAYYGPDDGGPGWVHGGAPADAIRRMLYVAVTRARESVTVLEPGDHMHAGLWVDERGAVAA